MHEGNAIPWITGPSAGVGLPRWSWGTIEWQDKRVSLAGWYSQGIIWIKV